MKFRWKGRTISITKLTYFIKVAIDQECPEKRFNQRLRCKEDALRKKTRKGSFVPKKTLEERKCV